ncbi:MAG: FtsX-like permease family protein [Verrucomicrobiae bacterium]|nr:FtsX-like permease family protein [Verrucomicrobiae bacterium]
MLAIHRKLIRDLLQMKGQALAISAVIGCGIAVFIGAQTTLLSLQSALASYYDRYRFSEVFTSLKRAPVAVAERVEELPGVAVVEDRIVEGVTLDLPNLDEPATGKIISLPDRGRPALNDVHLLEGRLPETDRTGEILAEEAFVKANGFGPGDQIQAVLNGKLQTLTIVGIGLSPEYLTTIQPGSLFPDDLRFGIFWMPRRQMEAAFDMEGAFNDLAISLVPGANEDEVIRRLDLLLDDYGGLGANGRDQHLSHRFISDEMTQLKTMSIIPPTIFLGVAAFLLNVALRRLLSLQREQIAALKAFGYSNLEVGAHYLQLIGAIVAIGVLFGWLLGTWMGRSMTGMYAEFYRFPLTNFRPDLRVYLGGALLSFAAGFVGVAAGVRQAVSIPPAEAMRPEPPPTYEPSLFERLGWHRWLSQAPRMILRELTRRPAKAGLTSLGIGFACAILIVGNFGKDAIDYLVDFQFSLQERHDATVTFHEAVPRRAIGSLEQIPGITRVETFRAVPVRLRHGSRFHQTSISGLEENRELYRLIDANENVIALPDRGLVMSAQLAKMLDLKVGDTVRVEVLEGERPKRDAIVSGLVDDFAGTSAWMNREALHALLREGSVISGAYLQIDPKHEAAAYRELKEAPAVASVTLQKVAVQSFFENFAENLLRMRLFNVAFASVIAIGVVYNSARVSFSERSRELATLRVIGFTRGEVSAILLGELGFLTMVAIPVGFLIGSGLCKFLATALETELYRIPFVLNPSTYSFAAIVIVIASILSSLIVRRGIDRLDLIAVLKSRE